MNDFERALRKHQMWFGSYTRDGRLIKVHVWCFLHDGKIEFLTDGRSLKARRARRNPQVICFLGSQNGPAVPGTAELIEDRAEVGRGYQTYWKEHTAVMLFLWWPIRRNIEKGQQIMVRVHPQEPNPFPAAASPETASSPGSN
jgi:general stress protein 26